MLFNSSVKYLRTVKLPVKVHRFNRHASHSSATGLDFNFSDEEKSLKDLAYKFSREEIAPRARHHDETGEFPWEIYRKAHQLGLTSVTIPKGECFSLKTLSHLNRNLFCSL